MKRILFLCFIIAAFEAGSVNTAIADTNWIEYNKKAVNDLYINKYLKRIPFTAADSSVLENIALQHAVTGGDAVFMARAMLRIEVHEQPLPLRKQKDTVQKTGNSNITLYPNPASNKVHLSGGSGKVLAKIYDHTGRLVLEQTVTNTINISSLETGVYSIKIFEHDEMIYYDRLVKLK